MATLFEQRRQQLEALTPFVTRGQAVERRRAARRQVLDAFFLSSPQEKNPIASTDTAPVTGGEGTSLSNSRSSLTNANQNPEANPAIAAAVALGSLDEDVATAREGVSNLLGLFGVANPVFGLIAGLASGLGVLGSQRVGTVNSTAFGTLATVQGPNGLRTFSGRDAELDAFSQQDINPELAMARREEARESVSTDSTSKSQGGFGMNTGGNPGGQGTGGSESSAGGSGGPSGGTGGIGAGGGIGL